MILIVEANATDERCICGHGCSDDDVAVVMMVIVVEVIFLIVWLNTDWGNNMDKRGFFFHLFIFQGFTDSINKQQTKNSTANKQLLILNTTK